MRDNDKQLRCDVNGVVMDKFGPISHQTAYLLRLYKQARLLKQIVAQFDAIQKRMLGAQLHGLMDEARGMKEWGTQCKRSRSQG